MVPVLSRSREFSLFLDGTGTGTGKNLSRKKVPVPVPEKNSGYRHILDCKICTIVCCSFPVFQMQVFLLEVPQEQLQVLLRLWVKLAFDFTTFLPPPFLF